MAALDLEAEVHCLSCYRQTKVDPADRRLNDRVFAVAPFRCGGLRDHGFAVPLQPCRAPGFVYIKPAVLLPAGGEVTLIVLSCPRCVPPLVHRAHACRPATLAAGGMGSRRPLSLPGVPRQDRLALPWADLAAELSQRRHVSRGRSTLAGGTRPTFTRYKTSATQEAEMARAGLLWLLGIPIPILLLMWALGWLH